MEPGWVWSGDGRLLCDLRVARITRMGVQDRGVSARLGSPSYSSGSELSGSAENSHPQGL